MDDATEHGSPTGNDPGQAPRTFGQRAWVRSVALVGGGLVAGGILAGTLTANAAEDSTTTDTPSVTQEDGTTTTDTPSVTQEDGTTTSGTTAPEDCPEGGAPQADTGSGSESGT